MRIIGGSARGRTLLAPRGLQTRPTPDAVRESLCNILRCEIPGATVLDLFAGTGALALECLSRGAERAALVDHAQSAMGVIRRNVQSAGFEGQTQCLRSDWRAALARLRGQGRFDLVFLDPPYGRIDLTQVCAALAESDLLAPDALIVAEHRTGEPPTAHPPLLTEDTRRYGDTTVTIIRYHQEGQ
ncbi:MAG: 16S rRNA (guanine(966)-N(2))-methyltransferase RsmD [Clostridia bacterium]|nr:16S rRNA (guanine(966)-N(2))-methyltransferase RsmD [Clostridia bacterium]